MLSIGYAREPFVQAFIVPGGNLQHLGIGEFFCQLVAQGCECIGLEQIGLIDDNEVGFLELLAVDVNDLFGEVASIAQAKNAGGPDRVD